MGAWGFGYKSELEFKNKGDDYEFYKDNLPEFLYALDGEEDTRGSWEQQTLFFKQGNLVIRVINYSDVDGSEITFVVYNLSTRTKDVYSEATKKTLPFEISDCIDLGVELSEEQKKELEESKSLNDVSDEDLPF